MNHQRHLIPFALIALAMILLVPKSSAGFGLGIGLILLLCPLVMGTMMWLMMRRSDSGTDRHERLHEQLADDHQPVSGKQDR